MFQSMSEILSRKVKIKNRRATVERWYLRKAAHNDKKVSIAKTHMERRVGRNVHLT
jgi:hypothetical protein